MKFFLFSFYWRHQSTMKGKNLRWNFLFPEFTYIKHIVMTLTMMMMMMLASHLYGYIGPVCTWTSAWCDTKGKKLMMGKVLEIDWLAWLLGWLFHIRRRQEIHFCQFEHKMKFSSSSSFFSFYERRRGRNVLIEKRIKNFESIAVV